ncbi:uncharacterized protein MELLADRAFT_63766 [Melampsora larici-populina 98AG31]|uniref:Uncharacterized protein n=1 Tax=Melampsora larici-populina (strain 98AG31 / pathotype 3-4-7) TaxID=747676 RepID=F4RP27_MELLP|nr:uncharacterized protein MELLADRAFT_63766 [Melampsora larici-populina 98AG31]EGG05925.1 hypothetical protein MELLADRAFT_63766 [Melampsora larici-populina 98AG31]
MSTPESSDSVESLLKSLMRDSPPSMRERIQLLQSLWDLSTLTVPEALLLLELLTNQKLQSLQALYHNPLLFRWLCDTERDPLNVVVVHDSQQDQITPNGEDAHFICESSNQRGNRYESDVESLQSGGPTTLSTFPAPKRPASSDSEEVQLESQPSKQYDQYHQIGIDSEEDDQSFRTCSKSAQSRNRRIIKPLPMRHRPALSTSSMSKNQSYEQSGSDEVSDIQSSFSGDSDQHYHLAMELEEDGQSVGTSSIETRDHLDIKPLPIRYQPSLGTSSSISESSTSLDSDEQCLLEINQLQERIAQLSIRLEKAKRMNAQLSSKPLSKIDLSTKKEVINSSKVMVKFENEIQEIQIQLYKIILNLEKSHPDFNFDDFKDICDIEDTEIGSSSLGASSSSSQSISNEMSPTPKYVRRHKGVSQAQQKRIKMFV